MPRGDRTGPMGMGPMSGRGAGFCTGFAMPGVRNPGNTYGVIAGRGCGGPGFGRIRGFKGSPAEDEKDFLRSRAEFLEKELQKVKKCLTGLDKDKAQE
ncbi:MAG TPA: hypothetical protein DEA44_07190 [Firmicutes bacterium]|nr:hypothetical protein [Bacillota bacterium]